MHCSRKPPAPASTPRTNASSVGRLMQETSTGIVGRRRNTYSANPNDKMTNTTCSGTRRGMEVHGSGLRRQPLPANGAKPGLPLQQKERAYRVCGNQDKVSIAVVSRCFRASQAQEVCCAMEICLPSRTIVPSKMDRRDGGSQAGTLSSLVRWAATPETPQPAVGRTRY